MFSLLVSYIFLHELPRSASMFGILVIVVASIGLSSMLHKVSGLKYDQKSIWLIIVSQIFYTLNSVILNQISARVGEINCVFYYSGVAAFTFLLAGLRTKTFSSLTGKSFKAYIMLFIFSVMSFFPFLTAVYAYRMLMLPVAYALVSFSLVFTVILGYLFLGEKEGLLEKAITGALMLLGGLMAVK